MSQVFFQISERVLKINAIQAVIFFTGINSVKKCLFIIQRKEFKYFWHSTFSSELIILWNFVLIEFIRYILFPHCVLLYWTYATGYFEVDTQSWQKCKTGNCDQYFPQSPLYPCALSMVLCCRADAQAGGASWTSIDAEGTARPGR